jgi:hypothetical protein
MNLRLLRGILLEELGRAYHGTHGLCSVLTETEHVLQQREFFGRMTESEKGQIRHLRRLFERFEAPIPEGHGQVIPALLAE